MCGDRIGADHLSQGRHLHRQVVLLDDASWPDGQQQLVFADDPVAMREKAEQDIEGAWA